MIGARMMRLAIDLHLRREAKGKIAAIAISRPPPIAGMRVDRPRNLTLLQHEASHSRAMIAISRRLETVGMLAGQQWSAIRHRRREWSRKLVRIETLRPLPTGATLAARAIAGIGLMCRHPRLAT